MTKNNKTYSHEQIRFEVTIIDDKPILNVFMEDGAWFAISDSNMRVPVGSQCHPEYYQRVWGKPMPVSSIKSDIERKKQ